MDRNTFDKLIESLDSSRPLRVVRLSHRDVASLEWKPLNEPWTHLMTIPNGPIYKTRHKEYKDKQIGVAHQSLWGVFNKLYSLRLINASERSKFL